MEVNRMKGQRKNFSDAFKAKVVLEVIKGQKTMTEIASTYKVHPNQTSKWKKKVLLELPGIFSKKDKAMDETRDELINELYRQIGQQKVEIDWLKKKSDVIC